MGKCLLLVAENLAILRARERERRHPWAVISHKRTGIANEIRCEKYPDELREYEAMKGGNAPLQRERRAELKCTLPSGENALLKP